jgi:hypothetical protein
VTIRTHVFVLQTLSAPTNAQFCILCVCSVCKVVHLLMLLQFVNQLIMHAVSSMKVTSPVCPVSIPLHTGSFFCRCTDHCALSHRSTSAGTVRYSRGAE